MANIKTTGYADYTYNSSNLLRRFSHRIRFKRSIAAIHLKEGIRILDFGCGDALFLNQLKSCSPWEISLLGYEPYLESISENSVSILDTWDKVVENAKTEGPFNYITCFEVLEHLPTKKQKECLEQILSLLKDDGMLVISVPIEKGFPALVKNMLRRRTSSKKKDLYSYGNILASFLGKSLPDYQRENDYLDHMGFYFTDLENLFTNYLEIESKSFSPFPMVGYHLNSQVFYRLRKRKDLLKYVKKVSQFSQKIIHQ